MEILENHPPIGSLLSAFMSVHYFPLTRTTLHTFRILVPKYQGNVLYFINNLRSLVLQGSSLSSNKLVILSRKYEAQKYEARKYKAQINTFQTVIQTFQNSAAGGATPQITYTTKPLQSTKTRLTTPANQISVSFTGSNCTGVICIHTMYVSSPSNWYINVSNAKFKFAGQARARCYYSGLAMYDF